MLKSVAKYGAIAIVLLVSVAPGGAQFGPPPDGSQGVPGASGQRPRDPHEIEMEKARLRQLNKERQAEIKKDTDKLLQLATELKQSVDKSNENTLSLDVVKKAAQIEKLAKQVKEKMKTGY